METLFDSNMTVVLEKYMGEDRHIPQTYLSSNFEELELRRFLSD